VNLLEESITYDEATYNLIKKRIMLKGDIIKNLLEVLDANGNDGIYKAEILTSTDFSDTAVSPALSSLYCTGLIDMKKRGTSNIYYLNKNSRRLLDELRRSIK
jgi:DNA-binding transcriptional ArsR family regulator